MNTPAGLVNQVETAVCRESFQAESSKGKVGLLT